MDKFNTYTVATEASAGLKAYLLKVYNYMGFGLIITALAAFAIASSPAAINLIYNSGLKYIVIFAPLAFILVLSFGINKLSATQAQLLFWCFALVNGISLSFIFLLYTGVSITKVFLITAVTFLIMSIYGYTTKADLSKFGAILFMGLIGIIIASIVNIFMKSSGLDFGISIIGVLIFTGLTAWDTQKIKLSYNVTATAEDLKKGSIFGALSLYLDFINLFLMLLRLMGDRR
ncbi:Inner membrane protein YbhL [Candidatus Hepatincola sp. Pdp]